VRKAEKSYLRNKVLSKKKTVIHGKISENINEDLNCKFSEHKKSPIVSKKSLFSSCRKISSEAGLGGRGQKEGFEGF
jgi:hypothetical protein